MNGSLPGSSVQRIFQARILEWVAISFSRDLLGPGIKLKSPALAGGLFTTEPPGTPVAFLWWSTDVRQAPSYLKDSSASFFFFLFFSFLTDPCMFYETISASIWSGYIRHKNLILTKPDFNKIDSEGLLSLH